MRLKSLQTASPYKLILAEEFLSKWATKLECTLHRTLNSYKIDENEYKLQGEFFKLDMKTRNSFIEMCKKIEHNFDTLSKNSTLKNPI